MLFQMEEKAATPNEKCAIYFIILSLFVAPVHWLTKTQPASAAHSTDSEVDTFYLATKMVQYLLPILQNLGLQVSDAPTPIYEDNQPTIDTIKTNHPTSRVKHIFVPIHYVHEQYVLLTINAILSSQQIHALFAHDDA